MRINQSVILRWGYKIAFSLSIPALLLLASSLNASIGAAEPSSPLSLSSGIDQQPGTKSGFTLNITIESSIALELASLEIRASDGVEFDQRAWQGSLEASTPIHLSFSGNISNEGEWVIAPYISASTGSTTFGAGETLKGTWSDNVIELLPVNDEQAFEHGPQMNWPVNIPFPTMISSPKLLMSANEPETLLADEEMAHFSGKITYEARDQFSTDYQERPLPHVKVEVWDIDEDSIRLLTPEGTYANDDGDYSIQVPVLDTDGTGIDPILLVYATDDTYVDVQAPSGLTWFYIGFYPSSDITGGNHPFDIAVSSAFDLEPFFIFDMIRRIGRNSLAEQVGWESTDTVSVKWPATCVDLEHKKSCYYNEKIYLNDDDGWDPDVILHEYTHFVLARPEYYGNARAVAACLFQYPPFIHFFNSHITKSCAWNEGWADFLQAVLQNDANYIDTFEDGTGFVNVSINQEIEAPDRLPAVPQDGISNADVEGAVLSVMWDLYDVPADNGSEDEAFDEVGFRLNGPNQNGIWTITTSKTPGNIEDFWHEWELSGNGHECRVATIMREYGIPEGPNAYTVETVRNASEGTIEIGPEADCPFGKYSQGTALNLHAVPKQGYEFFSWQLSPSVPMPSPPVDLTSPSIQLTVDRDWTVEAWFKPAPTPTPVPPVTIRIPISFGSDDAGDKPPYPEIGSCSFQTYANEIYFGECPDGADITSGFRFQDVDIPKGSTIQNAYISFTVNGPYENRLTLSIRGEDSGDAATFTSSSKPRDRATTSASASWVIPSSDTWGLGNERNTPDISSVIQEIVNRSDWNAGNNLVIIIADNGNENGMHRRVIGFERPRSTYEGHLAELVVSYGGSGGGPTPTATPSPSPSPTSTPQPTPEPCSCAITCAIGFSSNQAQGSSLVRTGKVPGLASLFDRSLAFIPVLQDLRDTILLETEEGQHFNDLYVHHSPELASIFIEHDEIWEQGIETIDLFMNDFKAILAGNGDEVSITQPQVDSIESFLSNLEEVASPELQAVLVQEREALPFDDLAGETFAQAQGILLNNHPPEALPGGPYIVEEGSDITLKGSARDVENDPLFFAWDIDSDGVFERDGSLALFSADGIDGPDYVPIAFMVCDNNGACDVDITDVEVLNVAPTASVEPDLVIRRFESAEIHASWTDPSGVIDEPYQWTWDLDGDGQADTSGESCYETTLTENVSFSQEGTYTLTFSVTDKDGGTGSEELTVEVQNQAPNCSLARPSIDFIWPPNHKFVPVQVLGINDPEGDEIAISVTSIFQDEVVDDGGDGNTQPDGRGLGSSVAEIRAERSGSRNGRFYYINFLADDGHGGICDALVQVGVPLNTGKKGTPIADGPLYDSTLP